MKQRGIMDNKIQFAVVREDPEIIIPIIESKNIKKILMLASGGCTALSYKSYNPNLDITLFDMNEHQIQLVKDKIVSLKDKNNFNSLFNINTDNELGLNNCGNFETLFKGLRNFIYDFVISQNELSILFSDEAINKEDFLKALFNHKYWKVAFETYFSDTLLVAMFGKDAIQHAPKNSYPSYFQKMIEKGLKRDDFKNNYFLTHILFGKYTINRPLYLKNIPKNMSFNFHLGFIHDIKNINEFDMIDLSNIFDWMNLSDVMKIINLLKSKMKKNSIIVYRQLNNEKPISDYFGKEFIFSKDECEQLTQKSRSLFYNKILVGKKV